MVIFLCFTLWLLYISFVSGHPCCDRQQSRKEINGLGYSDMPVDWSDGGRSLRYYTKLSKIKIRNNNRLWQKCSDKTMMSNTNLFENSYLIIIRIIIQRFSYGIKIEKQNYITVTSVLD